MTWHEIQEFVEKFLLLCAVGTALTGLVEIIFKPFRKLKERREEKRNLDIVRQKREERIDVSLGKIDAHLEEAVELAKWQESVDVRLNQHTEEIKNSKNERRVLWRAQRATLDGLKQLGANGMVTGAINEMDIYADDNIR